MSGNKKFNSDQSSDKLFCSGVPVSNKRLADGKAFNSLQKIYSIYMHQMLLKSVTNKLPWIFESLAAGQVQVFLSLTDNFCLSVSMTIYANFFTKAA